jgi:hypothetical protein
MRSLLRAALSTSFIGLLAPGLAIAMSLLVAPASALAASPDHVNEVGSWDAQDFCGTGVTVTIGFKATETFWDSKAHEEVQYTPTNPANGLQVIVHQSATSTSEVIPEANGGYAIAFDSRGTQEQIKPAHGGVITRDAGNLSVVDHFDANDNFLGSDASWKGPHPEYEAGGTLFCAALLEALDM